MATTTRLRKILYWSGGVLGLATVLTVAIHLGPVRKALGWKPLGVADATGGTSSGWCPFGFGSSSAVAKADQPHAPVDTSHPRAHARPALGFQLDATTKAQLTAWAVEHAVSCTAIEHGRTLECVNVPAQLLPSGEDQLALRDAWFTFGAGDTLVSVKTIRQDADATKLEAAFESVAANVTATAGAPTARGGNSELADLSVGALRQATVEYTFQDYAVMLRATNMGDRGYMMAETYQSIN